MPDATQSPKVGLVGLGWVGSQLKRYLEEVRGYHRGEDLFLYDTDARKNFSDGVDHADVVFVCLPSPRNPQDGSCDTSIIADGIRKLNAGGGKIIVIKSTVSPGTTEEFQRQYPKHKFLFNPEFLTESRAWEDMLRPDRQIVGFTAASLDAAHLVLSILPKAPFMSPWGTGANHRTWITATEAEFIKYAGNVYLVRKVNLANALAAGAAKLGADYENIRMGIAADHRIGGSHLDVNHGGYRGWGGYCFPKDLDAFIQFSKSAGLPGVASMLEADRHFNEAILAEQGLSLSDVSLHIDVIRDKLAKRKQP